MGGFYSKRYIKNDILELSELNSNKHILIKYLSNFSNNKLFIKVYYYPKSEFNPLKDDTIIFYIELTKKFPIIIPKITCHSKFSFPSLYDNRNYIIDTPSYSKNIRTNLLNIIIKDIPELIKTYLDNIKNKLCINIGEYQLNHLYVMNDFLENKDNNFLRVKKGNSIYYLIITDVYLLILAHYKETEKGKLIYYDEIININTIAKVDNNNKKFQIKWNENDSKTQNFIFEIINDNDKDFKYLNELIEKKTVLLKNNFSFFSKSKEKTINSILELIKIKEDFINQYQEKNEINPKITQDLIYLYQKAIEVLSEKGDERYIDYVEKLKFLA